MKFCIIFVFLIVFDTTKPSAAVISPVILIPGDGGNRLQAKLNKTNTVSHFCTKTTSDYVDLWVSLEEFTPISLPCFADNIRLVYDEQAHKTLDSPGVTVRVPGFGGTETVAWLESYHVYSTGYFAPIIDMMKKKLGYQENMTVFGVPFDFRRALNEQADWFTNVTILIEQVYAKNNNTSVTLVGHSMGNLMALYLLQRRPIEWKRKYIRRLVSIAAPWGGAVKPIRAIVAGDRFGVFAMTPLVVRYAQRSLPTTHFLMVSPKFWNTSAVLATNVGVKNYTLDNLKELYDDLNISSYWQMFQDSRNTLDVTIPPEVEVHCVHGANLPTPYTFVWDQKTKWPDAQPNVITGDGDGTVVMSSLKGCLLWQDKQKEPFYHQILDKVEHLDVLASSEMIDYLHKVLSGDQFYGRGRHHENPYPPYTLIVEPVNF